MDDLFLDTVLTLYKEDKWREILKLNEKSDQECALKLLWVWPSEENLNFIKKVCDERELSGIISVGCGCGLLEWILNKSIGIDIIGLEINKDWWQSKYSNPQFIQLQYCHGSSEKTKLNSQNALLFCYFNDGDAFIDYINNYEGDTVFIIGPGKGKGRHTNPEPFKANFGGLNWLMYAYQEVKNSKDFIVVYVRSQNHYNGL